MTVINTKINSRGKYLTFMSFEASETCLSDNIIPIHVNVNTDYDDQ